MTETHLEASIFGDGEHGGRPQGRRRNRRPRRGTFLRRWLTLLVALAVVGGGGYLALQVVRPIYRAMTAPGDYPGPGSGEVSVVIQPGDPGRVIAQRLLAAGVVKTTGAFLDAEAADPAAASSIQPGSYRLKEHMSGAEALKALASGANRTAAAGVTIREGLWASEIYPILAKHTGVPVGDYLAASQNPSAIGLPVQAKGNVEGWLFPATYQFDKTQTAAAQLSAMVRLTVQTLQRAGIPPAQWERTLIIGSIVEAEARQAADRPKVARVIVNRLSRSGPPPYGWLQLDSTVSYGIKKRAVTTTAAERADDNPWNTYKHPGLPVGPIDNPGAASIQAAAAPAAGPWLFFVTVNPVTGETKFAVTQAEHDRYDAQFQAWCTAHPGTC